MSTDLVTLSGPVMGTRWSARLAADAIGPGLEAALASAVSAVDRQMSSWRADSDLMRLNAAPLGAWVTLPEPLLRVLAAGLAIGAASDGAFDIGLGRVVEAWGFGPAEGKSDPDAMRAALGQRIDSSAALELDPAGGRARRHADLAFDLSGIAKGFGADELARVLRAQGRTDFLVGLDGELVASGLRPDGRSWAVALEEPDPERRAGRGMIELHDIAIATSGDYRHRVTLPGGQVLAHSINPRLGGPVRNHIASVSVLAPTCHEADAWATALLVLGEEAGPHLARAKGIDAIFLIRDGAAIRELATGAA